MTKIYDLLDIDNEVEGEKNNSPETNMLSVIGGVAETPEEDAEDRKLEQDFNTALDDITDVIELAKEAAEKISVVAKDTESDKDFNALTNLINAIVKSSETKVGLYSKKMEYKERKRKISGPSHDHSGPSTNIEKAVFIGTLDQLANAIDGKGGE